MFSIGMSCARVPSSTLERDLPDAGSDAGCPPHHAADHAGADVRVGRDIHRHRRGLGHHTHDFVWKHHIPGILLRVPDEVNQTARRDRPDGGDQPRHRPLGDEPELDALRRFAPARPARPRGIRGSAPGPRRTPVGSTGAGSARARWSRRRRPATRSPSPRRPRDARSSVELADATTGTPRKQLIPIVQHELQRRIGDGQHHVDSASLVFPLKVVAEREGGAFVGKAIGLQVFREVVDRGLVVREEHLPNRAIHHRIAGIVLGAPVHGERRSDRSRLGPGSRADKYRRECYQRDGKERTRTNSPSHIRTTVSWPVESGGRRELRRQLSTRRPGPQAGIVPQRVPLHEVGASVATDQLAGRFDSNHSASLSKKKSVATC